MPCRRAVHWLAAALVTALHSAAVLCTLAYRLVKVSCQVMRVSMWNQGVAGNSRGCDLLST